MGLYLLNELTEPVAILKVLSFLKINGVIFKINGATEKQLAHLKSDKRVDIDFGKMQKWYNFNLSSDRDLNGALEWFGKAYEAAGKLPVKPIKKTMRKK